MLGVRVATAVAVVLVTVGVAGGPIPPEALRHRLVPGERFVYESTTQGNSKMQLATRTEFTVLEVTPGRTTVRQQDFMWEHLSFEGTIRTDGAQGSWQFTSHEGHGPSIIPVWDPKRYGRRPTKAVDHWIQHTSDGDEDVTEHTVSVAPDAVTITLDGTFREKPAQGARAEQTISVVRRMQMTWTSGVLSELRYTVSTTVTLNGRASPSFESETIDRLVQHSVPP